MPLASIGRGMLVCVYTCVHDRLAYYPTTPLRLSYAYLRRFERRALTEAV
jgi:hypothetical protein